MAFNLSSSNPASRPNPVNSIPLFRDRFHIPTREDGSDTVYFCGNSLGLQPKAAKEFIERELEGWAKHGVEGHFREPYVWRDYHEFLAESTARVVGAKPVEVVVMNSLTVNLHLMMASFYRPAGKRNKIVVEASAFPSDQYAVKSHLLFHGFDPKESLVELQPREGEATLRTEDMLDAIREQGDEIALIMIGGVNYLTGQAFDMKRITEVGHEVGAVVGFDLAHAAGNLVMNLHGWDVDFAVWCSYKYLNGGPGCVGGCFVHERHTRTNLPRFAGWWGHDKETRFLMPSDFKPVPGAEGWQQSNPSVLAMAALRASMEIFDEVGMERLRENGEQLTGCQENLLDRNCSDFVTVITPRDPKQRGAQLSLRINGNGKALHGYLNEHGLICDWREPDVIRIAPVPLYNSYRDAELFVEALQEGKSVMTGHG